MPGGRRQLRSLGWELALWLSLPRQTLGSVGVQVMAISQARQKKKDSHVYYV